MTPSTLRVRALLAGLVASAALCSFSRPVAAQAPPAPPMAGMSGHGMSGMGQSMQHDPMMMLMAGSPEALLAHRTALALTAPQVASLRALQHDMAARHDSAMQEMAPLHARMEQAVEAASIDDASLQGALDDMGRLHARMMGDMVRSVHAARAILTPAQRERLAALPMHMDAGHKGMSCM